MVKYNSRGMDTNDALALQGAVMKEPPPSRIAGWAKTLLMPVQYLKGAGPYTARTLNRLGIQTVWDLICHLPATVKERIYLKELSPLHKGRLVTLILKAVGYTRPARNAGRQPYRIHCQNEKDQSVDLIFFHAYPGLNHHMPLNQPRVVSGELDYFMGTPTLVHPEHMGSLDTLDTWQGLESCYPLTAGITQKQLQQLMTEALKYVKVLPEWLPPGVVKAFKLKPAGHALVALHRNLLEDLQDPGNEARRRMAFDELFSYSLALQLLRHHESPLKGYTLMTESFPVSILKALPFSLTSDQQTVLQEIFQELKSGKRMVRLLEGDVGSGKTAIAFAVLALLAQEGYQGVLMAPTEILARQHAETLVSWAEKLGQTVVILTGQDKGKKKKEILRAIAQGTADFIVGTHALFQEAVSFHRLGLVVIDEQHRFGVEQRLRLLDKGAGPHLLSMTATPIPRTLLLTLYGDLDTSVLKEKPAYRQPIATSVIPAGRCEALIQRLPHALAEGHKIFWVCPLIEKSESVSLMSAEERFKSLQEVLGPQVGWIHGKMKSLEKEKMIQAFKSGTINLLVATTVVEVGIDVPEATMMIIEHAERFGLAQLHQLRGRVGRGNRPGTCLLIYAHPISSIGRQRLETLKNSNDGFELAEADLHLRGGGELIGYKQSGIPNFKFADLSYHQDLLRLASDEAKRIVMDDPKLLKADHKNLYSLLQLFNHGQSLDLLISG